MVDVNTGKFTGAGGNLEETVTRNNLEAAEEIVRQLRLRDIGGIIVIDFIDMVLESNRDLVLRRLLECLGRDRTKHQVAEVTSLGLVQMTRKRVGQGLLEVFAETCERCNGRGVHVHAEPVEKKPAARGPASARAVGGRRAAASGEDGAERRRRQRPAARARRPWPVPADAGRTRTRRGRRRHADDGRGGGRGRRPAVATERPGRRPGHAATSRLRAGRDRAGGRPSPRTPADAAGGRPRTRRRRDRRTSPVPR